MRVCRTVTRPRSTATLPTPVGEATYDGQAVDVPLGRDVSPLPPAQQPYPVAGWYKNEREEEREREREQERERGPLSGVGVEIS